MTAPPPAPAPPPPYARRTVESIGETRAEKAVWLAIDTLHEEVEDTRSMVLDAEGVARAVEQGLRCAVADPAFWAAVTGALQQHAKREAGGWLLGSISAALSRVFLVAMVVLGLYLVGGWAAVAKFWAAMTGGN